MSEATPTPTVQLARLTAQVLDREAERDCAFGVVVDQCNDEEISGADYERAISDQDSERTADLVALLEAVTQLLDSQTVRIEYVRHLTAAVDETYELDVPEWLLDTERPGWTRDRLDEYVLDNADCDSEDVFVSTLDEITWQDL